MRTLFVQIARQNAPEYGNHRRHARNAGDAVSSFFIRQSSADYAPGSTGFERKASGEHYFFELGRNLKLEPSPSRQRRALMMGLALPLSLPAIIRTARRIRPDVIYTSQQKEDVPMGLFLSRLLGVPHVLALHYHVGPGLGRTTLALIRRAPRLIAISESVRQSVIEQGADPEAIKVVYNSVEVDPFLESRDGREVRREFDIPETAPLLVSVGRLDRDKGHAELLQAFVPVREAFPEARLLICGSNFSADGYDDYLKAEAQRLGVGESVIFAGFRRDIPEVLAASDLFCLPSRLEAFGMVFVEAMAAGRPVVASRAGGAPEIVIHGETGLLSELDDVATMAQHIQQLLHDRELAQQMGAAGRERVQRHFVPAVRAPHWAKTVRELL